MLCTCQVAPVFFSALDLRSQCWNSHHATLPKTRQSARYGCVRKSRGTKIIKIPWFINVYHHFPQNPPILLGFFTFLDKTPPGRKAHNEASSWSPTAKTYGIPVDTWNFEVFDAIYIICIYNYMYINAMCICVYLNIFFMYMWRRSCIYIYNYVGICMYSRIWIWWNMWAKPWCPAVATRITSLH